jgi:hypothetical protein
MIVETNCLELRDRGWLKLMQKEVDMRGLRRTPDWADERVLKYSDQMSRSYERWSKGV